MTGKAISGIAVILLMLWARWLSAGEVTAPGAGTPAFPQETHLKNIRQLTFGGQNAEAYFSHDGKELIFQSTRGELECDAIFRMNSDGSQLRQLSSGRGVTTAA